MPFTPHQEHWAQGLVSENKFLFPSRALLFLQKQASCSSAACRADYMEYSQPEALQDQTQVWQHAKCMSLEDLAYTHKNQM